MLPRRRSATRSQAVRSPGSGRASHRPIEREQRDRKGLYAKARAGIVKEFTGVSDPYEEPQDAGLVIDTSERSPEVSVQAILLHLEKEGYIGPEDGRGPEA
jgi:hypothetical protein